VLEAVATPGHTHGSMSFYVSQTQTLFFCRDLVYNGTLYAHFNDSDLDDYNGSISMLLQKREAIKKIFPSHEGYPLPASWLVNLGNCLNQIRDGKIQGKIKQSWGEPVFLYRLEKYQILAKLPGSQGINLREKI
jgi:glyoxylase-like metal-dependent hydrolase (beta-lactamase superfamily II)